MLFRKWTYQMPSHEKPHRNISVQSMKSLINNHLTFTVYMEKLKKELVFKLQSQNNYYTETE